MDTLQTRTVSLSEFRLLCFQCNLGFAEAPTYQQVASVLHKYAQLSKSSLTITDAPDRDDRHATIPMTVYFDKKRLSSSRPVLWPSKQLQAIRKQEADVGRGKGKKKK